jgi:hypothetical protein
MRFGLRCWLASPFLLLICFAGFSGLFSGLGVAGFARFAATIRARYAREVPPLCSQGYFPGASQQHGPPACASPTVSCAERVYYAKIRRPWASPSRRFVFATQVQLAALRPCQRKSSSQDHQSEEDVKERPAATGYETRCGRIPPSLPSVRGRASRAAGMLLGSPQLWPKHHLARQHERGGYGTSVGGGGSDYRCRPGDLRRGATRVEAAAGASHGHR